MRTLKVYDTYSFKDKDPIIDEMRTAWQDSGYKASWCAKVSGVSGTTINNWFKGKTRSPQNQSACAFMGSLGYERKWVQTDSMLERALKVAKKRKLINGSANKAK